MSDLTPYRRIGRRKQNTIHSPFFPMLQNLFDTDLFSVLGSQQSQHQQMSVQMRETDTGHVLEMKYPGLDKDSIQVEYANNYLTISGKRDEFVEDKRNHYIRQERRYSEFKRSFYIDQIDSNKVETSHDKGVLKVTLPKKQR